jgi:hypothetical protein
MRRSVTKFVVSATTRNNLPGTYVRYWHKPDVRLGHCDVRYWTQRTWLATDPSASVYAQLCGLKLEQSFPASWVALPVSGKHFPDPMLREFGL